mmetsp:Transcript_19146/g.34190  ORF Transcript_19146/g.34190 Transcript_19146/m.34190 type:complete len:80 (+) Transcript_19146:159-398(+)
MRIVDPIAQKTHEFDCQKLSAHSGKLVSILDDRGGTFIERRRCLAGFAFETFCCVRLAEQTLQGSSSIDVKETVRSLML